MSLIHWWPLNGDTIDRVGRNNLQYINSSGKIVINNSGKLGKCYERTAVGASDLLRSNATMKVFTEESICAWVYVSQHAALKTANGVVTNHDHSTNSGLGIGVYSPDGANYYISINAGNGSGRVHSTYWGQTNIKDAWHHVCLVSDGSTIRMYVDGKEDRAVVNYSVYSKADYLDIFCWSTGYYNQTSYRPACKVCDVRVYDHALSQAEVKELSRALVVHYTFDDMCAEPTTNIITGIKSAHGKSSLYNNGVKIDWSAGGADSYFMFNYSQAIKANSVYTLSFDCEGLKSGEVATFAVSNLNPYTIALQNGKNVLTFTAGSDLMNDFNTHSRLFFDDKTRTNGAVFYLTNFQLEEKDHATPYTPTTRASMIRNEAETIQPSTISNIALTTDSASGSYSLKCAGSTYLNHTPAGDASAGTTASMWIKDMNTAGQMVVFVDANSKLAFGPYSTYSCISCQSGVASQVTTSEINKYWKTTDWNHVVICKNSSNEYSCFINGTKVTNTTGDYWTHSTYLTVGARYSGGYSRQFTGLIDDFRLYYTCLTTEEIQDLYKTKAYITNQNDMITHSYIEGYENIQITNNYNAETRDIQEIGNDEYEPLEYIASTGTQYIDTGVYWTSEKATIIADLEITTFKGSTTIFGSEERYSGSNRYFAHILHAGSTNGNYANYIGTGSIGATTSLTKDTRYILEYIAHGDNTFTTKTTNHTTGEIKVYNNKVSYTGTILTHQNSTQTAANRGNIYIFSNHNAYNGTDGIQKMAAMKLYRFTMIQDDIYIRDFIPCRRKSDSKVGLFDMVTGQFYTSPVGSFTAGGVVTNEDTTVKFLSDGSIQARQFIEI